MHIWNRALSASEVAAIYAQGRAWCVPAPADPCATTNPCQNGGTCQRSTGFTADPRGFTCACAGTGFEGLLCELDVDECNNVHNSTNGTVVHNGHNKATLVGATMSSWLQNEPWNAA
jgi:hypothetical protein